MYHATFSVSWIPNDFKMNFEITTIDMFPIYGKGGRLFDGYDGRRFGACNLLIVKPKIINLLCFLYWHYHIDFIFEDFDARCIFLCHPAIGAVVKLVAWVAKVGLGCDQFDQWIAAIKCQLLKVICGEADSKVWKRFFITYVFQY